jgi:lysophospholipase L1-like esterase
VLIALPRGLLELRSRDPDRDYDPARGREILRRIAGATTEAHARFLLVNLPDSPEERREGRSFFNDYCVRTGAECIDTLPLFQPPPGTPRKLPGPYRLPHNIHYSREGYAVVAEAVREYLETHPRPAQSGP